MTEKLTYDVANHLRARAEAMGRDPFLLMVELLLLLHPDEIEAWAARGFPDVKSEA